MTKQVVLYARISLSKEESVSVDRQLEAGRKFADAQGWKVIGEFIDDGVSASKNKPEDRPGWKALLASPLPYDAVIIWKVDRLARRTLDFLNANAALQERKAGIVAVADPINMTTPQGRAFATMLAVFAELEVAGISEKVRAARAHLLKVGRWPGGAVPYGWKAIKNPDGPGWVLTHHPDQIDWVRAMVDRVMSGKSTHSTAVWLNGQGVPGQRGGLWMHTTVRQILENPILAGMTTYNPGAKATVVNREVVRGEDGLPVINEAWAISSMQTWRALQTRLDTSTRTGLPTTPRSMLGTSSAVLSGLVWCQPCDARMHRTQLRGNESYRCKTKDGCGQTISNFEHLVIEDFLSTMGETVRWKVVEEVYEGASALLPEINQRLSELSVEFLNADGDEVERIASQMAELKKMQAKAKAAPPEVRLEIKDSNHFDTDWEAAETDEERRDVLGDALNRIWVSRGKQGAWTDEDKRARLRYDWRVRPVVPETAV